MNKIIFIILTLITFSLYTYANTSSEISLEKLSLKVYQLETNIDILNNDISHLKTKQIILLLGLLIAGVSLYLSWNKDKLKVSVLPLSMYHDNGVTTSSKKTFDIKRTTDYFGIQVTNFSSFPITIRGIGFLLKNNKQRIVLNNNAFYEVIQMPYEIKEKDSNIFKINLRSIRDKNIHKVFITLSTGEEIIGQSKALKEIIKR